MLKEFLQELESLMVNNCNDRHGGAYPDCGECEKYYSQIWKLLNEG